MADNSIKSPLHALMAGDQELVCATNCILGRIWRIMLFDLNVSADVWETHLVNYIEELGRIITPKKADNLKGNIPKDLANDEVTWKRFMQGFSILNFKHIEFSIKMREGDETKSVTVNLPRVFDDSPGRSLRLIWDMIIKEYPEKYANWTPLSKVYIDKRKEAFGSVPAYLNGSIKRSLSSDGLMWNVFYQALMIFDFDEITISMKIRKRNFGDFDIIELKLPKGL